VYKPFDWCRFGVQTKLLIAVFIVVRDALAAESPDCLSDPSSASRRGFIVI
jgi:hypothetical protein